MRVTSGLWVAAIIRRSNGAGTPAFVVRRGAEEAGAIYVKINRLNGSVDLYGPAPQAMLLDDAVEDRMFELLAPETAEAEADTRLGREMGFDPDIWIVEIETRDGSHTLNLVGSEPDPFLF